MKHDYNKINKTLDKAFDYSGQIMLEMAEIYADQEQPYMLHIMMLQCAYGLRKYGFGLEDILNLINQELGGKSE